ncbi:MAG: glycosyltransferase N-terminal domain-containing protein, partial [Longimicrobiales bacterium]
MSNVPFFYRASTLAARAVAPLLADGESKLARGLAGRRDAHETLARWGESGRDPRRPTVWVHAPSVGEALQAGAVLRALAERRADLQVVFTHFSPSGEGVGARMGAHVSAYLPWDLRGPTGHALDAVRPDLLVFTKTEVWPVLVEEALRRGVPVAFVAGTVTSSAGRLRWPARALLRATWASLTLACACSEEDAARLVALGVPRARVRVTGDPGVDSAALRAAEADATSSTLAPFHADRRPTVIAGSTWPEDDAVLLPALEDVRRSLPQVRAVLAPHEPTPSHVRALSERLSVGGWKVETLATVEG